MSTALAAAKQKLACNLDHVDPSSLEPISADPWVLTSLLQKAIRRGETEIAKRAANTLFALKGSAIWRRYMIIAYEDVGVGSIDAVVATVAAASDADFRKQCGGPVRAAIALVGLLAEAAKDPRTTLSVLGIPRRWSTRGRRCQASPPKPDDRWCSTTISR